LQVAPSRATSVCTWVCPTLVVWGIDRWRSGFRQLWPWGHKRSHNEASHEAKESSRNLSWWVGKPSFLHNNSIKPWFWGGKSRLGFAIRQNHTKTWCCHKNDTLVNDGG
jgi:hypothetical protein